MMPSRTGRKTQQAAFVAVLSIEAGNAPGEGGCTIELAPLQDSKEEEDGDKRRSVPLAPRLAGGNERQRKESEGQRAC